MLTQEYVGFFQELEKNNAREWFQTHKKRYEKEAKSPFLATIQKVLDQLNQQAPTYPAEAKATLFRLNRDIRFSQDKTPYHTVLKASIVEGGKKSEKPGIYLAADAKELKVGGGLLMIHPKKLKAFRQYVADHIEELMAITQAPSFAKLYKEGLKGESYKKPDAIAKSAAQENPYLLQKQFYYMQTYSIDGHLEQDLTDFILKHVEAGKPLNQLLTKALNYANDC